MSEGFVLRDVDVQAAAYSLPRPGAAPVSVTVAAVAASVVPAAPVPTLEEQLSRSYEEGVRAGRAAQAEAAFMERQAAAEEELKQALALAAKDGFDQGWAKATEEARDAAQEAQRQLDSRVQSLEALAVSVAGQAGTVLDGVEDELVGLCHDVLCRVLGEAAASPQGIRAMVGQALKDLPGQLLSVHLNPEDLAAVKSGGEGPDSRVRWLPDSSVVLGGAILKGDGGSLDARLETQLQALADKLTAVRAAQRAERSNRS